MRKRERHIEEEQRTEKNRRKSGDPNYEGVERRSVHERSNLSNRRKIHKSPIKVMANIETS